MNISELTDEQILKIHQYYINKYYAKRLPVSKIIYSILLGNFTLEKTSYQETMRYNIRLKVKLLEDYKTHVFLFEDHNKQIELYVHGIGGKTVDEYWLSKALRS